MPRGLGLYCDRHGGRLKYHDGSYYCVDEFDGSDCTSISVMKTKPKDKMENVK